MGGAAAGQAGFAALDMWQRFGQSQVTASKAYDRQKNLMTRGPTYIMKGLRDAGINPIIAAGGGISASSARAQMAAPTGPGSPVSADAFKVNDAKALLKSQTAAALQQGRLVSAQANIAEAQGVKAAALAAYYRSPEGIATLIDGEVNSSLPSTLPAAGIRAIRSVMPPVPHKAIKEFKETWSQTQERLKKPNPYFDDARSKKAGQ